MLIAYVGDFHNHGMGVFSNGTPLVYLLSKMVEIERIDLYLPRQNQTVERTYLNKKIRLIYTYDKERPNTVIGLLKIDWSSYDVVIINFYSTAFRESILSTIAIFSLPIYLKYRCKKKAKVIYHNSVFTNEFKKLGYDTIKYCFMASVLKVAEALMFLTSETYMPLKIYGDRIRKRVRGSQIKHYDLKSLEGITTAFINNVQDLDSLTKKRIGGVNHPPNILIHGHFGPQKDIETPLSALDSLRRQGYKFRLTLSGSANTAFQSHLSKFESAISKYKGVIDNRIEHVEEWQILDLFMQSDIVILPYNSPGGHSGVLETAMFYRCRIICYDFPEFREQASDYPEIWFTTKDKLLTTLVGLLHSSDQNPRVVHVKAMIENASTSIRRNLMEL